MSMTIVEFKESFRSVMEEEFQNVPSSVDCIDFPVSARFEKRMDKLIRAVNRPTWRWVNTAAKRVALVAITLLLLFSAAFSVKAVREPIIRFFTEIYEKFIVIGFEGDTSKTIEYVYSISEIPEGYSVIDVQRDVIGIITIFEGPNGALLQLEQSITDIGDISLDNEKGITTHHSVGNIPVIYYEREENKACIAIWVYDSYYFMLTHHGEIAKETIFNMIRSIE